MPVFAPTAARTSVTKEDGVMDKSAALNKPEILKKIRELSQRPSKAPGGPQTYWTTVTNIEGIFTHVIVPQAGTLWVYYEYENVPAAYIAVWHEGLPSSPIATGENIIAVAAGDYIVYLLTGNDEIILGYQMI
jgi:hypothetical protein